MATYTLTISALLTAKNLDSASDKAERLKETMERLGGEAVEVRIKGHDAPSDTRS